MRCKKRLLVQFDAVSSALAACLDQNRACVELFPEYIPHVVCYIDESVDVSWPCFWYELCSLVMISIHGPVISENQQDLSAGCCTFPKSDSD